MANGITVAATQMLNLPTKWRSQYTWNTFGAVVRAGGRYISSSARSNGEIDLNTEVCEPMLQLISIGWNKFFSSSLKDCLTVWQKGMEQSLKSFTTKMLSLSGQANVSPSDASVLQSRLATLREQNNNIIGSFHLTIEERIQKLLQTQTTEQRTVSPQLTASVTTSMAPIFTKATNIKGAGAFDKQIALLQDSFKKSGVEMFTTAKKDLIVLLDDLDSRTMSELKELWENLQNRLVGWYKAAWTNNNQNQEQTHQNGHSELYSIFSELFQTLLGNHLA